MIYRPFFFLRFPFSFFYFISKHKSSKCEWDCWFSTIFHNRNFYSSSVLLFFKDFPFGLLLYLLSTSTQKIEDLLLPLRCRSSSNPVFSTFHYIHSTLIFLLDVLLPDTFGRRKRKFWFEKKGKKLRVQKTSAHRASRCFPCNLSRSW